MLLVWQILWPRSGCIRRNEIPRQRSKNMFSVTTDSQLFRTTFDPKVVNRRGWPQLLVLSVVMRMMCLFDSLSSGIKHTSFIRLVPKFLQVTVVNMVKA
jgi:hypothetical protein